MGEDANSTGAAPTALPPAAADSNGNAPPDAEELEESPEGWARQLERCLGGSASKLSRLARIDAVARGIGTIQAPPEGDNAKQEKGGGEGLSEAEDVVEGDGAVRVPAGNGADKAARARVHRAIQETFPFVKVRGCALRPQPFVLDREDVISWSFDMRVHCKKVALCNHSKVHYDPLQLLMSFCAVLLCSCPLFSTPGSLFCWFQDGDRERPRRERHRRVHAGGPAACSPRNLVGTRSGGPSKVTLPPPAPLSGSRVLGVC